MVKNQFYYIYGILYIELRNKKRRMENMSKNYDLMHFVQNRITENNISEEAGNFIKNQVSIIEKTKETSGYLSNTVALYVCLKSIGIDSKIRYGLSATECGQTFYNVWLEIDGKIIDLSIYGLLKFGETELKSRIDTPIIMGEYGKSVIQYSCYDFGDDYEKIPLYDVVERKTIYEYINSAPSDGMRNLICNTAGLIPSKIAVQRIMGDFDKNIKFTDFKEG